MGKQAGEAGQADGESGVNKQCSEDGTSEVAGVK